MGSAKRYLIIASILLLAISPFLFLIVDKSPKVKSKSIYQNVLESTYLVESPEGHWGTGVLLPNGSLLTSRHIMDENSTGFLELDELEVKIQSSTSVVFSGIVVYQPDVPGVGGHTDWCVIYVRGARGLSNIKTISELPKLGDEVFTVGFPSIRKPHLYMGHQSIKELEFLERASISAFPGNSGGGLYNSQSELIGLVTLFKTDSIGFGQIVPVPQWMNYISLLSIKEQLKSAKFENLLD